MVAGDRSLGEALLGGLSSSWYAQWYAHPLHGWRNTGCYTQPVETPQHDQQTLFCLVDIDPWSSILGGINMKHSEASSLINVF